MHREGVALVLSCPGNMNVPNVRAENAFLERSERRDSPRLYSIDYTPHIDMF